MLIKNKADFKLEKRIGTKVAVMIKEEIACGYYQVFYIEESAVQALLDSNNFELL